MKRFQRILLTAGLLVSLSGCDAISDPSSDIPEQIAVADSTTESSDAETAEAVTESESSLAETESTSKSTSTQTTLLPETVSTTETTTTAANADALVGDTGLTTSEWLEKAQELYETAAKTMFQYCCTSQMFQYDFSDSNQPNYYHITDYDTIADATEPYYEVFSRKSHSGDFDSLLLEADVPPFLATAAAMALSVLAPATPSAVRPFSSWKRLTAVSVFAPKLPVISAQ